MRLDVRKSLTLGDAKQMTPTVNLMNPQWRQTFQGALKKLGGEALKPFPGVTFRVSPDTQKAVEAETALRDAQLRVKGPFASASAGSLPEAESYFNKYDQSLNRVGQAANRPYVAPDLESAVRWSSAGDYAGNALAMALRRSHPYTAAAFNIGAPLLGLSAPAIKNHTALLGEAAAAPDVRLSTALAKIEAQRLRGEGGRSAELGELYARTPDILSGYRDAPKAMSQAEQNTWVNPGLGWSTVLSGASKAFPIVGSVAGGVSGAVATHAQAREAAKQNAEIDRLNSTRPADEQLPHVAAPSGGDLAGNIVQGAALAPAAWSAAQLVGNPLTKIPAAALAANAVSGMSQMAQADRSPEVVDQIRRAELGQKTGPGAIAFRTLMGDPLGAAAALDPGREFSKASEREAFLARRDTVPGAEGGFVNRDMDKINRRVGEALQAAPSVPNGILAQLLHEQATNPNVLKYMATDAPMSDIARQARVLARAWADQNQLVWEDPRVQQYQATLAKSWGDKPSYKISDVDARQRAVEISHGIAGAWNIPLTSRAVNEIARLVQIMGPDAVTGALVPSADRTDPKDEMRLQAVLNSGWVPKDVYQKGNNLYRERLAP